MTKKNFILCLLSICIILAAGCEQKVILDRGSYLSQSCIWVDGSLFDDTWSIFGGATLIDYGPLPPPLIPASQMSIEEPVPTKYMVRWFSYTEERFFKATLVDSSIPEKAREIVKKHNAFTFSKTFLVAIGDNHEVQFWLGLSSSTYPKTQEYVELLAVAQGHEIEGDNSWFKE